MRFSCVVRWQGLVRLSMALVIGIIIMLVGSNAFGQQKSGKEQKSRMQKHDSKPMYIFPVRPVIPEGKGIFDNPRLMDYTLPEVIVEDDKSDPVVPPRSGGTGGGWSPPPFILPGPPNNGGQLPGQPGGGGIGAPGGGGGNPPPEEILVTCRVGCFCHFESGIEPSNQYEDGCVEAVTYKAYVDLVRNHEVSASDCGTVNKSDVCNGSKGKYINYTITFYKKKFPGCGRPGIRQDETTFTEGGIPPNLYGTVPIAPGCVGS
jgi:hypothetical protein